MWCGGKFGSCTKGYYPKLGIFLYFIITHVLLSVIRAVIFFLCYSYFAPLQVKNKPQDGDSKHAFILGLLAWLRKETVKPNMQLLYLYLVQWRGILWSSHWSVVPSKDFRGSYFRGAQWVDLWPHWYDCVKVHFPVFLCNCLDINSAAGGVNFITNTNLGN